MDWSRGFIFNLGGQGLSVGRYSFDQTDIDVDVGLLFMNQEKLATLAVDGWTGKVYTFDPNRGELLILE